MADVSNATAEQSQAPASPREWKVKQLVVAHGPLSMSEIMHQASGIAGRHAKFRLYNGEKPVIKACQIHKLQAEGGEIEIRLDAKYEGRDENISVHHADYRDFSYQRPREPLGSDDTSTLTRQVMAAPFEGESMYKSDYLRFQGAQAARSMKPSPGAPTALSRTCEARTGRSSYPEHFPSYGHVPRAELEGRDDESVSKRFLGRRFEHDAEPPRWPTQPRTQPCESDRHRKLWLHPPGPLQGSSTYSSSHQKHSGDCRMPLQKPAPQPLNRGPFQGTTEHRDKFQLQAAGASTIATPRLHLVKD